MQSCAFVDNYAQCSPLCVIVRCALATLAGLVILYGWGIIPGRLIQFAGSTPLYCVLVSLLYASPVTGMVREQTQLKEAAK